MPIPKPRPRRRPSPAPGWRRKSAVFLVPAMVLAFCIGRYDLDKSLYLLAGGLAAYALLLLLTFGGRRGGAWARSSTTCAICRSPCSGWRWSSSSPGSRFSPCGSTRRQRSPSLHFHSTDTTSAAYNDGADWVGVLFAAYSAFAALAAFGLAPLSRRIGLRATHLACLVIGGLSFLSFRFIQDPKMLLLPMAGIGIAWAAILAIPYSLLSGAVPAKKMGVYMGIFNFFIVIPQLVAASLLGFLLKTFFGNQPINALMIGGASLIIAGLCVLMVRKETVA